MTSKVFVVLKLKTKTGKAQPKDGLASVRGKYFRGKSPVSAAMKVSSFFCQMNKTKCKSSKVAVQIKEVRPRTKNGVQVHDDVIVASTGENKIYNYVGGWKNEAFTVKFGNTNVVFKGKAVIQSCLAQKGKKRSPLCNLLGKSIGK